MYTGQVTVRFGDIDQAGIVYYPRFFHYFHMVYEDWFRDRLIPLHALIRDRRIGFPVVNLTATFRAPLRYGDICPVELTLTRLGGTSVTWHYRIFQSPGKLAAEATIVTACMDLDTQSGTLIPQDIRARLEAELATPGTAG